MNVVVSIEKIVVVVSTLVVVCLVVIESLG